MLYYSDPWLIGVTVRSQPQPVVSHDRMRLSKIIVLPRPVPTCVGRWFRSDENVV